MGVVVPLTATAAQKCIESVTVIIEPEIKSSFLTL